MTITMLVCHALPFIMLGILLSACTDKSNKTRSGLIIRMWGREERK